MNTQREQIEKLLSEESIETVRNALREPDIYGPLKDIYSVLLEDDPNNMEILQVLERHSSTHIVYLVYGDYLARKNRIEEAIDQYKTAAKLTADITETISILKRLIFGYLQIRDIPGAFYTGWTLIEMNLVGYNMRLLRFICGLVTKEKFAGQSILGEAERTERLISENIKITEEKTVKNGGLERVVVQDLEIIGNSGMGDFLKEHKIDISKEFEVGIITDTLPYLNILETVGFSAFIQEYHNKVIPEDRKTELGMDRDVILYFIMTEDILMLYKLAEYFYSRNNYFSALVLFRSVIELFTRIDTDRTKFMQLATTIGSNMFYDVYFNSPTDYDKFIISVKKFNLSLFIVKQGKSQEHPLDKVFYEHFKDKISLDQYTIPNVYKNK
ncbi:hypothetical protein NEAUS04_0960 [Nematocida ausubeli]|uniref:Uncharacterized protein n=1 Tax=Nematocida ausubeli (strain ATCC PRA-371 / ERTm2) TaxID=1913371 RepID=A0A086J5G4_NEMA1|nr:uncharacterized protein NESG_00460 [Nematocida ausubeli]KAI5162232.1 hypothetical protein NEAUS04_0960 [Nematocida ausubeli]KFG27382.1 hypothetical protein NESG_00460 [Nematocida ausubeli]